jgi:hypothetical protein
MMINFTNPLGFLGLLAVPTILTLHLYRSRRRRVEVGGLHLWNLDLIRQPIGRKRQRLHQSVPLYLELLAAVLASLLLAGAHYQRSATQEHLIVIVDDSASMTAENPSGKSPAALARDQITGRAGASRVWTLIAAGLEPRLLAGPQASSSEMLAALEGWEPRSTGVNLPEAIALARQFAAVGQRTGWFSDQMLPGNDASNSAQFQSFLLGERNTNAAILFSDRQRISPDQDRIFLVIEGFGAEVVKTSLQVVQEQALLAEQTLELTAGRPVRLEFEIAASQQPVVVQLAPDAMSIDNRALLAPPRSSTVSVFSRAEGDVKAAVDRVVEALPNCFSALEPNEADVLVVSLDQKFTLDWADVIGQRHPKARMILAIPKSDDENTSLGLAESGFVPGRDRLSLLEGVGLEGVLWTYSKGVQVDSILRPGRRSVEVLLRHEDTPLIALAETTGDQLVLLFNANLALGNLTRTPSWPIFIFNLVQQTRRLLPGSQRSTYRVGEPISVNPGSYKDSPWQLSGTEDFQQEFERLPPVLVGLPVGYYYLQPMLAEGVEAPEPYPIAVNFQARGESELAGREWDRGSWGKLGEMQRNPFSKGHPVLFYLLLVLLVGTLAGLWYWQEHRT